MKPTLATLAFAGALTLSACSEDRSVSSAQSPARAADAEWTSYGSDVRNTKHSHLSDITAQNVKDLRVVWRWSSPDNVIAQNQPGLHVNLFEGTPVMLDGSLYVTTGLHQVARIDARTGETLWVYDSELYKRGTPQRLGFIHRGAAVWREGRRVFLASGDAFLTALDIETGTPIDEFGKGGRPRRSKHHGRGLLGPQVLGSAWVRIDPDSAEGRGVFESLIAASVIETCDVVSTTLRAEGFPKDASRPPSRCRNSGCGNFVLQ